MTEPERETPANEFERASAEAEPSLVAEFLSFVRDSRKYWLIPILIVLGLVGLLAVLASTGAAPFIYTVF